MPRWSAVEDALLRRHVAAHGRNWTGLEEAGAVPGRSARGMEWRWTSLVAQGRSLEVTSSCGSGTGESYRLPPCKRQKQEMVTEGEGGGEACVTKARYKGVEGSAMGKLRLDEIAGEIRSGDRRVAHGRCWTAALETAAEGVRGPAKREREKLEEWGINGLGPTRVTVLPRAEQMLGRGKKAEQVHIGTEQKLPTLMASRSQLPVVSGCAAGGTRLLRAGECARLMGICQRSAAWQAASRRLEERALFAATADGLDAHAVRVLWRNAIEMAEEAGCGLGGRVLQYAGMFAGALDTIFTGGRGAQWVPALRYAAVAERDAARRRCVSEAYAVPVEGRFGLASEMARRWTGRLDVLSATPSCRKVSSAPHSKGGGSEAAARKRCGRRQLLADVEAVRVVAERCRPTVIMIEETACLHSHHRELYDELQAELGRWPYEWRHGLVDSADLGASHHRRRVLWVGVRRAEAAVV
jgi:hypothetical protein